MVARTRSRFVMELLPAEEGVPPDTEPEPDLNPISEPELAALRSTILAPNRLEHVTVSL